MRACFIFILSLLLNQGKAQQINDEDSIKQLYLTDLKTIAKTFTNMFYPNYVTLHQLSEKQFVAKIDSVRDKFNSLLNTYNHRLSSKYIEEQQQEIKYYFDKLLIEYPGAHETYAGNASRSVSTIPNKLKSNLADFNKPELLANSDFRNYVNAFFDYQVNLERQKSAYKKLDNQLLHAIWKLIPNFISDPTCRAFWQSEYLYNHIDNNGIKGIESIYYNFISTCKDTAYTSRIISLYSNDSIGRQGHLINTYKTVDGFNLDIHMFLPDSFKNESKRPVIVFFHGGSWSEGKPDWFFGSCKEYAAKGWVACAVEYRTYSGQGTLPFAAVMDARSAIRWLRKHAVDYNIDTNRIVASGNSAGGHLVLFTALADDWDEKTDDLSFSAMPNVLLVNSGVYDLTDKNTAWIRKDLKNKDLVKEISPGFLCKKNFPPTLIIHGTNDQNVPYTSAEKFVAGMIKAGNNNIDFESLQGAGHFIWFGPYSSEVSRLSNAFLSKLGY